MRARWNGCDQHPRRLPKKVGSVRTNLPFRIAPAVQQALDEGSPVVALESTVISHGLPYPANLELAREMESIIRREGVLPATIAVLGGQACVGLESEQLEHLARGEAVRKVSRRDLPLVVGLGLDGATTVAATMLLAHQASIELFATGGIGGVHRGQPFDVSADLTELGRTPMTVVCAGAKAILDLPATREMLETQGVPVIGYGSDEMAAFTSRCSGLPADIRVDSPQEAARIIRARQALGLSNGLLITVPVEEEDEIPPEEMEGAIAQAHREAEARGISGAALTPFVLARLDALTGGRSVRTNVSLLHNNARVAARIALALSGERGALRDGES
jgi:pseudouridine-5'-phosphate glycosidase